MKNQKLKKKLKHLITQPTHELLIFEWNIIYVISFCAVLCILLRPCTHSPYIDQGFSHFFYFIYIYIFFFEYAIHFSPLFFNLITHLYVIFYSLWIHIKNGNTPRIFYAYCLFKRCNTIQEIFDIKYFLDTQRIAFLNINYFFSLFFSLYSYKHLLSSAIRTFVFTHKIEKRTMKNTTRSSHPHTNKEAKDNGRTIDWLRNKNKKKKKQDTNGDLSNCSHLTLHLESTEQQRGQPRTITPTTE